MPAKDFEVMLQLYHFVQILLKAWKLRYFAYMGVIPKDKWPIFVKNLKLKLKAYNIMNVTPSWIQMFYIIIFMVTEYKTEGRKVHKLGAIHHGCSESLAKHLQDKAISWI